VVKLPHCNILKECEIRMELRIRIGIENYNNLIKKLIAENILKSNSFKVGDTIKFAEKSKNKTRIIIATLKAIDDTVSITPMEDYYLLDVKDTKGQVLLENKNNIIRSRGALLNNKVRKNLNLFY